MDDERITAPRMQAPGWYVAAIPALLAALAAVMILASLTA